MQSQEQTPLFYLEQVLVKDFLVCLESRAESIVG